MISHLIISGHKTALSSMVAPEKLIWKSKFQKLAGHLCLPLLGQRV